MLDQATLVCFAATSNAEAATHFYRDVLGLRFVEEGPFALVFDANGTALRIQKVQAHTPAKHTTLGWNVPNIREQIRSLTARGVVFQRYGSLPQDEDGIWRSPSGAQVAWFCDPDGNTLSLTQSSV